MSGRVIRSDNNALYPFRFIKYLLAETNKHIVLLFKNRWPMSKNKLNVVFVVDVRNWAFDSVAKSLKKKLSNDFSVSILYWEDFPSPIAFLESINSINPDCVHFFFREQLSLILSNVDVSSVCLQRFCRRAITSHIPDYLYSDEISLMNRKRLLTFVDAYFTTNSDLLGIYESSPFVPDPWGVIHDWIDLEPAPKSDMISKDKIRIVWSGNSLWGEYAGHVDYKGLKTVIIPALQLLSKNNNNFEFVCLDSSIGKISNKEVLAEMHRADILVVASEKEGTPLTLIEAMANSCAIVSTNVGVASEVLPKEQLEFLYDRSSDELFAKLEKLICNRALIRELGYKNNEAWKRQFGPDSDLLNRWRDFLNSAMERFEADGSARKVDLLPRRINLLRARKLTLVRWAGRIVKKLGMVTVLNKISPRFATVYHRLVHAQYNDQHLDYSLIEDLYKSKISKIMTPSPIVIGAPMWKGVAASTQTVFPDCYLRFPFTDSEYPEVAGHNYLDRMSELLAQSNSDVVIFSGGSLLHKELARLVKNRAPNKRQYFMWHGSPAQWVDINQLRFFSLWREEYETGVIDGIICLKYRLSDTLKCMGIRSFYLMNPVPVIDDTREPRKLLNKFINVGLFSSISSWAKNPFPQLLSIASCENISLTTNIEKSDVDLALPNNDNVKYIHHMDRQDFISVLKKQDINLYVTNTECSPMIALESWACLIPCIVGPAGDVYTMINEKLGTYLVEKNVDSPAAISERIRIVIENYDEIVDLLEFSRPVQRERFRQMKQAMLTQL